MWQQALRFLDGSGWDAEDIERACEALAGDVTEAAPPDLEQLCGKLGVQVSQEEADALLELARLHDQVCDDARALRDALRNLERFLNRDRLH
jgi:hypothetical protein